MTQRFNSDVEHAINSKVTHIYHHATFAGVANSTDTNSHTEFLTEIKQYNEFFKHTGIRASRVERIALTALFCQHPITHRQAMVAWNSGTLCYYDMCLKTKPAKVDLWLGLLVAGSCLAFGFILLMSVFFIGISSVELRQVVQFVVFVVALFISVRYQIAPTYIARRIRQCLLRAERIS